MTIALVIALVVSGVALTANAVTTSTTNAGTRAVVLFVGPSAENDRVARVAERLAAEPAESPAGFIVLRKLGPTPEGFPRRPGVARKRPLA